MNNSFLLERNDTGIMSLADLFRRDRLPCRTEPKDWLPPEFMQTPQGHENRPAANPAPKPAACP